jgi:GT2 family glycosyltransferase
MPPSVTLVVPTLGRSPLLEECLRALAAEAGAARGEVLLVEQGGGVPEAIGALAGRRLRVPRPLGFAAAVNLGIAVAEGPWVAVVNDDAVVAPGWLGALLAALAGEPRAASAQGLNLLIGDPSRVDGRGLAWNRWLQAVQLGHGEPAPAASAASAGPPYEVFGVSATAALYRRAAIVAVAGAPQGPSPASGAAPPPEVFDSRLGTYYEDADLAGRLRAAGHTALFVPAATVRHAGGLTTGAGIGRWRQVYGNRYLVAGRLLGRSFWRSLPRMAVRDLLDLVRAAGAGDLHRTAGIAAGWARAARRLPGFLRGGEPVLALDDLAPRADSPRPAEAP